MARKNNRGGKGNKKAGRNKDKGEEYRKRKGIDPTKNRARQGRRSPKSVEDLLADLSGGRPPVSDMEFEYNLVQQQEPPLRATKYGKVIKGSDPIGNFRPNEIKSRTGSIRYVNPFNESETIYFRNKNGKIKWVNPKFVIDSDTGLVRIAKDPIASIMDQVDRSIIGGEADAMYNLFPRLKTLSTIDQEVAQRLTSPLAESAYGYGPTAEYIGKLLYPSNDLLHFGSGSAELVANSDAQIAKIISDLNSPYGINTVMGAQFSRHLENILGPNPRNRLATNLLGLIEMYLGNVPLDPNAPGREVIIHDALSIIKNEMQRKGLGRSVNLFPETLVEQPYPFAYHQFLGLNDPKTRLLPRGKALVEEQRQKKYMNWLESWNAEAQRSAIKQQKAKELSSRVANFDRVKQMQAMKDVPLESKIAQAKAAIAQERSVVDLPFETPGKITQSTAKMIEQDSFRAASVLHSSKLGYAAVGAAAIMGFAGYNQLTGRKRRVQKELEQG